jgi:hypothetical protein
VSTIPQSADLLLEAVHLSPEVADVGATTVAVMTQLALEVDPSRRHQ